MSYKLELLKQLAHGIAVHFGADCEIVIHDLKNKPLESSIIYIENGHITNRKIGDGPSAIVVETLHSNPKILHDKLAYLTKTTNGNIIKSSTLYIRGEDGLVDYILSINYDITVLCAIEHSLKNLTSTSAVKKDPTTITHNVNDLLDILINEAVSIVGKPVGLMTKDDKIKAIQYLNEAGAFLITKSGDKVSAYFGISKFTLYNYLDAAQQ